MLAPALVVAVLFVPMRAVPYIARDGETVEAVAQNVYGAASGAAYIAAANNLTKNASLKSGQKLTIPTAASYKLKRGDHLALLAKLYLGDPRRAAVLASLNNLKVTDKLREGQEIVLPFLHPHRAEAPESVNAIAKTYYGDPNKGKWIADFNFRTTPVVAKGDRVLVPIAHVRVRPVRPASTKAQIVRAAAGGTDDGQKKLDESAARATGMIGEAKQRLSDGAYAEALLLLDRVLIDEVPTDDQVVELLRLRGELLVSLGEDDLAAGTFRELLARRADYTCDEATTSPKICAALLQAKKIVLATPKKEAKPDPPKATDAP